MGIEMQMLLGGMAVILNLASLIYALWHAWKSRVASGILIVEAIWLLASLFVWVSWLMHALNLFDFGEEFLGTGAYFVWMTAFLKSIGQTRWIAKLFNWTLKLIERGD